MDEKSVLKNLTDYDSWEFTNYKLVKDEADIIINSLKKQIGISCEEIEEDDVDQDGCEITRELSRCPICKKIYRFSIPNYCERCGQKLER